MTYAVCDIIIRAVHQGPPEVFAVDWDCYRSKEKVEDIPPSVREAAPALDAKEYGWKALDNLKRFATMREFTEFCVNYPAVVGECVVVTG